MNLFIDKDSRFRGLTLKVGAFVVVGLIASASLLAVLAERQGFFQARTELLAESPTGADLRPGMAVKLSGFKIGEVRSVSLNEQARVDVLMRIEDRYLRWIKADSFVSVAREGLIGDSHLAITGGSPKLPPVQEGDVLDFQQTPGLADIAQDLRARALPVIDGMTEVLAFLNDPDGDFRRTTANLRVLSAELRETRKQVDKLLDGMDTVAREDVRRTLANVDETLATIEKETVDLARRSDHSLEKLDAATASATEAADAATRAIESASPRADRLLENADAAVRETRQAIDGASRRWPFRGGKLPPETPTTTTTPGAAEAAPAP